MNILEVRDGFIKFSADNNIHLSSFVRVEGMDKNYIGQVIQVKNKSENIVAYAKLLFVEDNQTLLEYDKTQPVEGAEVGVCDSDVLFNTFNVETPVIIGKTLGNNENVVIDISAFDNKFLISSDDSNANNTIIQNLTKQFNNLNKKVIIIDTQGDIKAKKYIAGVDFKLPLDTNSLNFMYEDCLDDATADSKSLIMEIFKDLSDYSRTVPFLPFGALKTIVDDMVDKSHVFKLLVLKNKLSKLAKTGYFASKIEEVQTFDKILNSKCAVIDLSKLDNIFKNRFLNFIYEKLSVSPNTNVILELSNVISKRNLKEVLQSEQVKTTFISHSQFKYLNDIKSFFSNFAILPIGANNTVFKTYATFLHAMNKTEILLVGEAFNYIPIVSEIKNIDEVITPSKKQDIRKESRQEPETIEDAQKIQELEIIEKTPEFAGIELQDKNEIQEQVDESINERTDGIISSLTQDLTQPENLNMFGSSDVETSEDAENSTENAAEDIENKYLQDGFHTKVYPSIVEENSESEPDNDLEEVQIIENGAVIEPKDTEEPAEEIEIIEEPQENVLIEEIPAEETKIAEEIPDEKLMTQDAVEEITIPEVLEFDDAEINAEELIQNQDEISIQEEPQEIPQDFSTASFEEFNSEDKPSILEPSISDDEILLQSDSVSKEENSVEEETEITLDSNIDLDLDSETNLTESEEVQVSDDNSEQESMPVLKIDDSQNDDSIDFDEIVELDPNDISDEDIIVDINDEPMELNEETEEQIVKDVDKVFTTIKDDEISDNDLDFIDELNSEQNSILGDVSDDGYDLSSAGFEEEQEEVILEEQEPAVLEEISEEEPEILEKREANTPMVPVYDADIPQEDLVESDPIAQGDTVTHAKYGTGVVEKMIKYGNKTLFAINFDNIGRRLLDPTLTEIKRS